MSLVNDEPQDLKFTIEFAVATVLPQAFIVSEVGNALNYVLDNLNIEERAVRIRYDGRLYEH